MGEEDNSTQQEGNSRDDAGQQSQNWHRAVPGPAQGLSRSHTAQAISLLSTPHLSNSFCLKNSLKETENCPQLTDKQRQVPGKYPPLGALAKQG